MSIEAARAFSARVDRDENLQREVSSVTSGPPGEALRNVLAIGAREGFELTAGELQEATSELSDEQLEAVAGGAGGDSQPLCYLKYKLDRVFVKSWSTSGDA